jgi:hypothetical protein
MMSKFRIAAIALGLAAPVAGPAVAQQFSADLVMQGREASPGKIYVADGKVRMENVGGPGVMLADARANSAYVLMPQQKMYLDMKMTGRMTQVFMPVNPNNPCPQWQEMAKEAHKDASQWSCKRVGNETVNGRSTVKYQAASPQGEVHYAWLDTKLNFLMKTQDPDGKGMELKNIKEGAQPASLFEIPAGYQKMDMQQMMQQRMQQRGGGKP